MSGSPFSVFVSDDAVGLVGAFIEGRCEVKLMDSDLREALEMFVACMSREVNERYGIKAPAAS